MTDIPDRPKRVGAGICTSRLPLLVTGVLLLLGCGEPGGPDYATLVISTTSLPNAVAIAPYSASLVATGGDGSYTWSVSDGSLPTGLSLTDATGVISGTPTGPSSTFTVEVVSGDGQIASQELTVAVYAPLTMTTRSLPSGITGVAYRETLVATGGDNRYAWSITIGSLPTDLSLTDASGIISGTPTGSGSTFTVQVVSGDGQTASRELTITVAPVLEPAEQCSEYPDYAVAAFEDRALSTAIATALSVSEPEDLTCGLVAGLTEFSANEARIRTLVGLQNLTGLTSLYLRRNAIRDVRPLSGLTELHDLDLSGNAISDISALSGLTNLARLNLWDNSISDARPLSGLTELRDLDLSGNAISDVGPLSDLRSLTSLSLYFNALSDISALGGLTNLVRLSLWANSISDITALSGLSSLEWLSLERNAVSDVSALSGLTRLTHLELHHNAISDISALSGLTSLTFLLLMDNSIGDIGALHNLTSLTWLALGQNVISDISALSGLLSLTGLSLDANLVSDISALGGLTSLTTLWLTGNTDLADIDPLLDNPGLGPGDMVYLESTNVSCMDVTALQAKGVSVRSNCP